MPHFCSYATPDCSDPAPPLRALPCFTQVRDQLTTAHEQELLRQGGKTSPTLSRDAVLVDAVVNTGTPCAELC